MSACSTAVLPSQVEITNCDCCKDEIETCNEAFMDGFHCNDCHRNFHHDCNTFHEQHGEFFCDTCFSKEIINCDCCEYEIEVYDEIFTGAFHCNDCHQNFHHECETYHELHGEFFCDSCFNDQ